MAVALAAESQVVGLLQAGALQVLVVVWEGWAGKHLPWRQVPVLG